MQVELTQEQFDILSKLVNEVNCSGKHVRVIYELQQIFKKDDPWKTDTGNS